MATNVAVSLFLQRLLHEKYMEDSRTDALIHSIIRGTGISLGSKASFIEYTNNLLSEIGFMLVRLNVAGKKYYSLKDLDSSNNILDTLSRLANHDQTLTEELNEDDFKTPVRNLAEKLNKTSDIPENLTASVYPYPSILKLNPSKFTHLELMVYIDSINTIISTGKPLPLKKQGSMESWTSICSKRSILDESVQLNLFHRFESKKWLEFYGKGTDIAPGIRFYFEVSNYFDMKKLNKCESCNSTIIMNESVCQECKKFFHLECFSTSDFENMEGQVKCFTCSIT